MVASFTLRVLVFAALVLPLHAEQPAPATEGVPATIGFETFATEPTWGSDDESEHATHNLDAVATCQTQLAQLASAIGAFRLENDAAFPVWLSRLAPVYLRQAALICPADAAEGDPLSTHAQDPGSATSYLYELSPSEYEVRRSQIRQYGGIVPIVRCLHHVDVPLAAYVGVEEAEGETTLTVGADLRVYAGRPEWREDRRLIGRLYADIRSDIEDADGEALSAYPFGVMKLFDENQLVALRKALDAVAVDEPYATMGGYQKLAGAYYARADMPAEAIAHYTRAVAALPADPEVQFALGVLHGQAGDAALSVRFLEEGVRLQPDTVDVTLTLARQYARDGRQEDLLHVYGLLRSHFRPESLVHNYALGSAAYLAGEMQPAREAFERVLKQLPPGTPATASMPRYAIARLASIYERQGDPAAARVLLGALDAGMAQVGRPAAALNGYGTLGAVTLDDYAGEPIAVAFWRSDNAACRTQLAYLEELRQRLDRRFSVVAVNVAPPDLQRRETLYASGNIASASILNAPEIARAYAITSVPAVVLVDRSGIIRYRHVGHGPEDEGDMDRHLRGLIAEEPTDPKKPHGADE